MVIFSNFITLFQPISHSDQLITANAEFIPVNDDLNISRTKRKTKNNDLDFYEMTMND